MSSHATLHPGAVILAHTSVGPGSTVGRGARTIGNVFMGDRTIIGIQAGILHGVTVGSACVVGALSLVNRDLDSNVVSWGTPASTVRTRLNDDP